MCCTFRENNQQSVGSDISYGNVTEQSIKHQRRITMTKKRKKGRERERQLLCKSGIKATS